MLRTQFETLRVYQLAEVLADEIWQIVNGWPGFPRATIGGQIVRAADSVGANIAEGSGRGSFQDNRRFVRIARGSLSEVQHWLRRAYQRNLLSEEQISRLRPVLEELTPKINAYLKSIGRKNVQEN